MDRLTGVGVFVAVVETGSFTAAGEKLRLSKAAVSKQIARLEERLGARLLNRTTRRLSLTEAGSAYLAFCQRILAEAEEAERVVGGLQLAPSGILRVSAPMSFGVQHLTPVAADYLARYPAVGLDLVLNDRYVDLVDEGFDLAIRIGDLPDSSLIGRTLAASRRVLVAAPSYLAGGHPPRCLDDIRAHCCISYSYQATGEAWRYRDRQGRNHLVPIDARLRMNNGDAVRIAVLAGLGLATLPEFLIRADLAAGRLCELPLIDGEPGPLSIQAVYPPGRSVSAKVRSFIDHVAAAFAASPP